MKTTSQRSKTRAQALRTNATYRYLDNRMIHLQAAVTISEQDIIPVSAVSQTCGYLIWEQGVPNPTNNNTVLPSRTARAQDQRHYAASEWWAAWYHEYNRQTYSSSFFSSQALFSFSFPFSIVNAASDEARSITRNTIPRLFTVVCRCQSPSACGWIDAEAPLPLGRENPPLSFDPSTLSLKSTWQLLLPY